MNRFGQISLIISALIFGGFGVSFLGWPQAMTGLVGIELIRADSVTDIRATYGGFEIGMAVFLAICAGSPSLIRPGLMAQAATLGGFALARLFGIVWDGSANPSMFGLCAGESLGCVIGLIGLRMEPRDSSATLGLTLTSPQIGDPPHDA